ncbi:MAG: hypothetical protein M1827_003131 [Pycnora praestabilis]|nr:MAG: hypothetical protein M1827_003131 [Pycnora praestabilis]
MPELQFINVTPGNGGDASNETSLRRVVRATAMRHVWQRERTARPQKWRRRIKSRGSGQEKKKDEEDNLSTKTMIVPTPTIDMRVVDEPINILSARKSAHTSEICVSLYEVTDEKCVTRQRSDCRGTIKANCDPDHEHTAPFPTCGEVMCRDLIENRRNGDQSFQTQEKRSQQTHLILSPRETFAVAEIDPFSSFPGTPRTQMLLHHAFNYWAYQVYTLDQVPASNPLRNSWLPFLLNDPASYHGLVYTVAMNHFRITGDKESFLAHSVHKVEAIKTLAKRVEELILMITDETIAAVLTLSQEPCISMWMKSPVQVRAEKPRFDDATVHWQGLKRMIQLRGGSHAVEQDWLIKNLYWHGVEMALLTWTTPDVSIPECFDAPFRELLRSWVQSKDHRNGLLAENAELSDSPSEQPSFICQSVSQLLLDISCSSSSLEQASAHKASAASLTSFAVSDTAWCLLHRILSSISYIDGISPGPCTLDEICRLAAATYIIIAFLHHLKYTLVTTLVPRLKTSIEYLCTAGFKVQDSSPSLLWALLMGGVATFNLPERALFVTWVAKVAQQLQLETWNQVREAIGKLPWFEMTCGAPCKKLWDEVVSISDVLCF